MYKKSFRRGFSDCMRLTWNRFGANEKKKKKERKEKRKKEIERGEKKKGKVRANN